MALDRTHEPPHSQLMEATDKALDRGLQKLLQSQQHDGHFVFELEADATIPAEYILLRHFRDEPIDYDLEAKIAKYLYRIQGEHGGWPLFYGGKFNISASVKAYFALKMSGADINDTPMRTARQAILNHGGAETSNVFTRILLALYGQIPWTGVPVMPVEIMLLPKWFPFNIDKISYWARTVLVPLLVVMAKKPVAKNPLNIDIQELFVTSPEKIKKWPKGPQQKFPWAPLFETIDRLIRPLEPLFPAKSREIAIQKAEVFVRERLNGLDGLGAIFPAMVNLVLMYDVLGKPADDPIAKVARQSIDRLLVFNDDEAYCQPCVSPVWDTALSAHTLYEIGGAEAMHSANRSLAWLKPRQILDLKGDWASQKPDVRPGGWAFQYANAYYPDVDDTAVVALAMDRARTSLETKDYDEAIERAREWVEGLQSRNGGWGAFDADNNFDYLNYIPFADHGALLDPPTSDVSARCLSLLGQLGQTIENNSVVRKAVDYLLADQESDGSWYGRWGMNYIYGTWSVLCAFNAIGLEKHHPAMTKAQHWLLSIQNTDGGWGESGESYEANYKEYQPSPSTASQTAWALMALMASGIDDHLAITKGIDYLIRTQADDGFWEENPFTATGFPRVFYLRYHGYSKFFPLWALARYRNIWRTNAPQLAWGM